MRLRRAFGVVSKDVARDPSISASAKALYLVLCSYADDDGVCIPSNETLATDLGYTERAVQKWLAELTAHAVLIREKRFAEGRETTSRTRLTDATSSSRGELEDTPGGEQEFVQNKTTRNKTSERAPTRATPAPSTFPITDRMREWWASKNCPDVAPANETEKFLAYHRAKGSTFKDWYAAWQNWMLKAMEGPPGQARKPDSRYPSEEELLRRMR